MTIRCIVSHDEVAEILGVHAKSFEETYVDKTMELKQLFIEHVKTLRAPKSRTGGSGSASADASTNSLSLSIQVNPYGFPIAPAPTSWQKVNKEHMESLYRTYMTQHYRKYQSLITVPVSLSILGLASTDKERQAPFHRIASKQTDFIKSKYTPRGINLDDPRTMKRESIVKLFEHIAAREVSHGVQDAFGFKNILSSHKQGALLPYRYSGANSGANDNITPAPRRKSKSQRRETAGNHNDHAESPGTQSSTQQQQAFYHPGVTPSIPTMPGLSLDPAFSVDPPIDVDPELDPAIHFGTISPGMVTAPVATSPHDHSLGDPKLVDNINEVPAAEGGNTADTPETNTVDMVGKR